MPWTLVAILTISLPLAGVNFFVARRMFQALSGLTSWSHISLKRWIIGIHLSFNLLPVVFFVAFLFGGRNVVPAFSGDSLLLDILLSYPFWISLIVMIQLLALFVLLDIIAYPLIWLLPRLKDWWLSKKPAVALELTVLVVLYTLFVVVQDTWSVRIVREEAVLPRKLSCMSGFRIALVADVQGDGRTTRQALDRYVSQVNSLDPDVVLFGGDLVTSGTSYIESTAAIMGKLRAKHGTFAALGDHDLFTKKSMVLEALTRYGVHVFEDTTIFIPVDSCKIALSIVTYTYLEKPKSEYFGDTSSGESGVYRIMLAHQPAERLIRLARKEAYNLFVAGHTHGGGLLSEFQGCFS